ncbi:U2-like protein [Lissonota sp. PSUC_FEM 10030012]|nr:U2-like protein [Lissonota sp. PSUC_FEM 10030012]
MEQNDLRDNMICRLFETFKFRNGIVYDRNSVHDAIERSTKIKRLLASRVAHLRALISSNRVGGGTSTCKMDENLCAIRLLLCLHKHLKIEIDRSCTDRILDILRDVSAIAPNSVVDDIRNKFDTNIPGFASINGRSTKRSYSANETPTLDES